MKWKDARREKPDDRMHILAKMSWGDVFYGTYYEDMGMISPESTRPKKWEGVEFWTYIPEPPERTDPFIKALKDVYPGDWKHSGEQLYELKKGNYILSIAGCTDGTVRPGVIKIVGSKAETVLQFPTCTPYTPEGAAKELNNILGDLERFAGVAEVFLR